MSQGYNPQGGQRFNPQGFNPQGDNTQPYPCVQSPLVWSILSMFFCCCPFGIISVAYATQVNTLLSIGAYNAAQEAAYKAKMWAWIAFWPTFIIFLIYLVLVVIQFLLVAVGGNGGY